MNIAKIEKPKPFEGTGFDHNFYPTYLLLIYVRNHPAGHGYEMLIEAIKPVFEEYGRLAWDGSVLILATGGWSGCEDIITAMQENVLLWASSWRCSQSGGHYEFEFANTATDLMIPYPQNEPTEEGLYVVTVQSSNDGKRYISMAEWIPKEVIGQDGIWNYRLTHVKGTIVAFYQYQFVPYRGK